MKRVIMIILVLLNNMPNNAATITSAQSGNWNSTSSWTGGIIPTVNDDVIIGIGHSITLAANGICSSLSFDVNNTSSSNSITINSGAVLTIVNDFNAPGTSVTVKIGGTFTLTGAGTISCNNLNVGNLTLPGGSGTTAIQLTSTISNLIVSNNINLYSSFNSSGSKYNNPILDLQSGSISIGGAITSTNQGTSSVSTITTLNGTQSANVTFTGINPIQKSATGTTNIYLNGTNCTFDYSRNGDQTVYPTTYKNLKLSGSGTKTTTSVTVNGSISVSGSAAASTPPTYSTPPNISYTGSYLVTTGNELPSTVSILKVNNTAGVTLNKLVTATTVIVGDEVPNSILLDGGFRIATSTLTLTSGTLFMQATGTAFPTYTTLNKSTGFKFGYTGNGAQTLSTNTTYDDLILGGSGVKTTTGITINGKLTLQGTATVSNLPTYGGSSSIEYNGSSQQTTGSELQSSFSGSGGIIINNSSGVVLNSSATIINGINLSTGKLTLGSNNLTVGSISGGSSSSYVITNGSGVFRKLFTAGGSVLFYLGDASTYSPASVTVSGGSFSSAYIGAAVIGSKHPNNSSTTNYINRYWRLSQNGITGSTFGVELTYSVLDVAGTETELYAAEYNGSNWSLFDLVDYTNHKIIKSDITLLSEFTAGEFLALPVELASFSAYVERSLIKLNWQTATEVNNYGFEVERCALSAERQAWVKIGFVNGNGNSNSPKSYSFADNKVSTGKYSYRLKQIDNDGQLEYSKAINVDFNGVNKFELSQNFPNPFNPSTKINYQITQNNFVSLKVYDVLGNEVATLINENKPAGNYEINFDASSLSSGVYLYKLQADNLVEAKKMILLR